MMMKLFKYGELAAMCRLRIAPALAEQFIAARKRNPSFGLIDILTLAAHAVGCHEWGWV
jgi:hypothetical protein